jgi:hypothetical protein
MTYVYICEEITAEWLSFGEEDSVQINAMAASEVEALREEVNELRIKVAHGAATSDLGQGKQRFGNDSGKSTVDRAIKENFGTCLVPACNNDIEAPKFVAKRPTMCRTCWGEFHDGDEPSLALKDKRVVTKTPNGKYTRSVTIKALMARCQNPAEYLTDHVHDFCSSVTVMSKNQSKIRIGKVPAEIKVATVGKKGCSGQRVFALTDNCAARALLELLMCLLTSLEKLNPATSE